MVELLIDVVSFELFSLEKYLFTVVSPIEKYLQRKAAKSSLIRVKAGRQLLFEKYFDRS